LEERIGALPGLANALGGLAAAEQHSRDPARVARSHAHRARADALAATVGLRSLFVDHLLATGDEWALRHKGDDWSLEGAGARGVHYLRTLLANPRRDVLALDLAAGGDGLVPSSPEPVIDESAREAYRARLGQLDTELDAADRSGDQARADRLSGERDAIVSE